MSNAESERKIADIGTRLLVRQTICDVLLEMEKGDFKPEETNSVLHERFDKVFGDIIQSEKAKVFAEIESKSKESAV